MQQPARQVERINIFQGKLDSKKLTKLPDTHRPVRDLRMSIPCDFQCYYICSYILAIYLFGGGFPGGSVVKSPPAKQKTWVRSLSWEDPLEKGIATHSNIPYFSFPVYRQVLVEKAIATHSGTLA